MIKITDLPNLQKLKAIKELLFSTNKNEQTVVLHLIIIVNSTQISDQRNRAFKWQMNQ